MSTTELKPLSTFQARAAELRQRLQDDVNPKVQAAERELSDLDALARDWRTTTANVGQAEQMEGDRDRLRRRVALLKEAQRHAEADLRVAEADVEAERIHAIREELTGLAEKRLHRTRDILAAAETLSALLGEWDDLRREMVGVAGRAHEQQRRHNQSLLTFGDRRWGMQGAIEKIFASRLPSHLWELGTRGEGGYVPDPVAECEGNLRGVEYSLHQCADAIVQAARGAA